VWCTPRLISIFVFAVMLLGDSLDALAQSAWSGDGEMLLAEATRQPLRRRERTPPPVEQTSAEASDEAPEASDASTPAAFGAENELDGEQGGGDGGQADSGDPGLEGGGGTSLRRSDRMDFDERLVKGQGVRSGAVYLFKRTPRKLPELVSLRTSYRDRIVEPVLGQRVAQRPPDEDLPTKTQAVATPEPQAPLAEKAPPESTGPSKAEIAREQRRQQRLRARRRRRRAAQRKAQ
jgi:hypothetical protein